MAMGRPSPRTRVRGVTITPSPSRLSLTPTSTKPCTTSDNTTSRNACAGKGPGILIEPMRVLSIRRPVQGPAGPSPCTSSGFLPINSQSVGSCSPTRRLCTTRGADSSRADCGVSSRGRTRPGAGGPTSRTTGSPSQAANASKHTPSRVIHRRDTHRRDTHRRDTHRRALGGRAGEHMLGPPTDGARFQDTSSQVAQSPLLGANFTAVP